MRAAWTTRPLLLVTFTFLLAAAPALAVSPAPPVQGNSPLIVHEWGTFLSVQGSDGVTLGGMVDNDEVLPPFVETRSIAAWRRSMMRVKGETPVTYFYTDRPRVVQVKVDMPEGILTNWYPNVCRFGPSPLLKATTPPRNSYLDWCNITLLPAAMGKDGGELKTEIIVTKNGQVHTGFVVAETKDRVELVVGARGNVRAIAKKDIQERGVSTRKVSAQAVLPVGTEQTWRYVRDTDSALIRVDSFGADGAPLAQYEKFLFYRGVGTFPMPLDVRTGEDRDASLRISLQNNNAQPLRGLFLIRIDRGTIQFGRLDDLAGKANQHYAAATRLSAPLPLDDGVPQIKNAVASALVDGGLYDKEARAMVNTWERSYFRSEGWRILYLVPRERVDAVLPIHIKPEPDRLVRVMVGRIELLTPTRERQIEKFVADLGADDFRIRQAASTGLARLGRLGEPALRRVLATSSDAEVRTRAQTLIGRMAPGN